VVGDGLVGASEADEDAGTVAGIDGVPERGLLDRGPDVRVGGAQLASRPGNQC
jgi:hypothetical protein